MTSKQQIQDYVNKALALLKQQTLSSDELKARSMLQIALAVIQDAEDPEASKSGAV